MNLISSIASSSTNHHHVPSHQDEPECDSLTDVWCDEASASSDGLQSERAWRTTNGLADLDAAGLIY